VKTIKYKGHKPAMPVLFPIGARTMSAIKETKKADPFLEMSDEDAHALVKLDPANFEIVVEEKETPKKESAKEVAPKEEVPEPKEHHEPKHKDEHHDSKAKKPKAADKS
jgi:hypothetical protein